MPRITTSIVANNDLMALTLFLGIAIASLESQDNGRILALLGSRRRHPGRKIFYDSPSLLKTQSQKLSAKGAV